MFRTAVVLLAALYLAGCGGGGGSPAAGSGAAQINSSNVVAVAVDGGPSQQGCVNCLFTSVTVCPPGDSAGCQTIDGVLVDTGSSGLRLVSAHADGALTVPLPGEQNGSGDLLGECNQYVDSSFSWGAVRLADVKMGGETAAHVPITILSDPDLSTAPSSCQNSSVSDESTVAALGANGILGLSTYEYDCGAACVSGGTPPAIYYDCPSAATCTPAFVDLAKQVPNPVARFAKDNNGVIVELDPVANNVAAPSVGGSLVFGIDTQTNNALGSALVFPVNGGNFMHPVQFASQSFSTSFIDSGSNGVFFTNLTGIPECRISIGFYCPSVAQTLTATNAGANGQNGPVSFLVGNAEQLFAADNGNDWAFGPLAGSYPAGGGFDWGLPFFFGRHIYVAIENHSTASGPIGPFWAY